MSKRQNKFQFTHIELNEIVLVHCILRIYIQTQYKNTNTIQIYKHNTNKIQTQYKQNTNTIQKYKHNTKIQTQYKNTNTVQKYIDNTKIQTIHKLQYSLYAAEGQRDTIK